ncbi:YceI family protein [Limibacter armeniacum]|uniref:YceI family protein n=1 Tax=Limibacter armeniacum TaxID=466084 RepID=UPI002FE5E940
MKPLLYIFLLLICISTSQAQRYKSESATVSFYSEAPVENISAENQQVISILDLSNNEIAFVVPITGFEFEKSLMQEHFNEKYLESEKYPTSTFKGKITGLSTPSPSPQEVQAIGKINIHGVEQEITATGTIVKEDGIILLKSSFPIRLADFDIKIPKVVFYNIAEVVEVTMEIKYAPIP